MGAVASIISNRKRDAALAAANAGGGLTFKPHAAGGGEGNAPLSPEATDAARALLETSSVETLTNDEQQGSSSSSSVEEATVCAVEQGQESTASLLQEGGGGAVSDPADSILEKMEGGFAGDVTDVGMDLGEVAEAVVEGHFNGAEGGVFSAAAEEQLGGVAQAGETADRFVPIEREVPIERSRDGGKGEEVEIEEGQVEGQVAGEREVESKKSADVGDGA